MERIIETPIYEIVDDVEVLQYTIKETYDDTTEIIDEEEVTISELVEKRRIMPDGDVYIINGCVEQYIPINPIEKQLPEQEQRIQDLEMIVADLLGGV